MKALRHKDPLSINKKYLEAKDTWPVLHRSKKEGSNRLLLTFSLDLIDLGIPQSKFNKQCFIIFNVSKLDGAYTCSSLPSEYRETSAKIHQVRDGLLASDEFERGLEVLKPLSWSLFSLLQTGRVSSIQSGVRCGSNTAAAASSFSIFLTSSRSPWQATSMGRVNLCSRTFARGRRHTETEAAVTSWEDERGRVCQEDTLLGVPKMSTLTELNSYFVMQ